MFIYEGHMGGLFARNEELSGEELFCDQCGDSDWLIGEADTREEALELFDGDIDDVSGGWDRNYINEFLNRYFGE